MGWGGLRESFQGAVAPTPVKHAAFKAERGNAERGAWHVCEHCNPTIRGGIGWQTAERPNTAAGFSQEWDLEEERRNGPHAKKKDEKGKE